MNIDSIQNGVVIDHITAGRGMRLYELLHLQDLDCSVAMIRNVSSRKMGKKLVCSYKKGNLQKKRNRTSQ